MTEQEWEDKLDEVQKHSEHWYEMYSELKEELESKSSIIADLDESEGNLVHSLEEAKEIIKYLLSFIQKENYRTRWDIDITKAENFLKGE